LAEHDLPTLLAFIEVNPLAALVTGSTTDAARDPRVAKYQR
jgi:hypothetical protein